MSHECARAYLCVQICLLVWSRVTRIGGNTVGKLTDCREALVPLRSAALSTVRCSAHARRIMMQGCGVVLTSLGTHGRCQLVEEEQRRAPAGQQPAQQWRSERRRGA